ncbi:thiol reductase thioredoxin [candidate division KSB1 bacterium]|nr:MAG: thiol reductase thioredoxin [candidate division KSB1 bacterium]
MGFLKRLFTGSTKPGKPIAVTDESFEQEVLNSDLPAVVDFWSPTCAPCQVMGGLLNELGPEFTDRLRIFKLNVEQSPDTAEQYRIRGVPTLVFLRKGREVDRVVGLMPLHPLRAKLEKLAS